MLVVINICHKSKNPSQESQKLIPQYIHTHTYIQEKNLFLILKYIKLENKFLVYTEQIICKTAITEFSANKNYIKTTIKSWNFVIHSFTLPKQK